MDLRLELVSVPVADVDRAKAFYVDQVGFGVEQDVRVDENHRFVELMPPGSPVLDRLDHGLSTPSPAASKESSSTSRTSMRCTAFLRDHDVDVSEIQDYPWGRFCFFSDPDGNGWSIHGPLRPE